MVFLRTAAAAEKKLESLKLFVATETDVNLSQEIYPFASVTRAGTGTRPGSKARGLKKMKNEKSTDLYHLGFNVAEALGHF